MLKKCMCLQSDVQKRKNVWWNERTREKKAVIVWLFLHSSGVKKFFYLIMRTLLVLLSFFFYLFPCINRWIKKSAMIKLKTAKKARLIFTEAVCYCFRFLFFHPNPAFFQEQRCRILFLLLSQSWMEEQAGWRCTWITAALHFASTLATQTPVILSGRDAATRRRYCTKGAGLTLADQNGTWMNACLSVGLPACLPACLTSLATILFYSSIYLFICLF